jgi:hypothetical protein
MLVDLGGITQLAEHSVAGSGLHKDVEAARL